MATIVIDPGHGGTSDLTCSAANHARGPVFGTLEKSLTLDVGIRVRRELERRGHSVVLSRDRDVNVDGRARAALAKTHNADVLVSIHFNASDHHNAQGSETYVHTRQAANSPSAALCRALQASVLRATGLSDRNRNHPPHFIQKASWCVINPASHATKTAAVLTEVSFLDRADEERRLQRDSYKDEIANAIANGIESYLGLEDALEAVADADDGETEDAVSLAAWRAGISVEEFVAGPRTRAGVEGAGNRGHLILDDGGGALEGVTPAAHAMPLGGPGGADRMLRLMAESLLERPDADEESGANDADEFARVAIGEAPDFEEARYDLAAATAVVESMFAGVDVATFDFPAFEEFIRGLKIMHFTPMEFLFLGSSNTSGKCKGKNRLPPKALWPNIAKTARMLDRIRATLGAPISILSGYRSEAYNDCVDGKPGSPHKRFNAIDWRCTSGSVSEWATVARQVRASHSDFRGGIGIYPGKRFIHIDTRGVNRDW